MRISKKELIRLEEEQKALELQRQKNALFCCGLTMRRLNLQVAKDGRLFWVNDDNELTDITFDGKICKPFGVEINQRIETHFDLYNNPKLCCGFIQYYLNEFRCIDLNMLYLTNKVSNSAGQACVILPDNRTIKSNMYNKDTLKYIDLLFTLDGALPFELEDLKGLDI